jgi:LCP family protein required for cell wall assembly
MDNFRKFKAPHKTSRGAVDGFVGSGRREARINRRASIGNRNSASSKINNFAGSDGFHANTQNKVRTSSQAAVAAAPSMQSRAPLTGANMPLELPGNSRRKNKSRSKKRKVLRSFAFLSVALVLLGSIFFGNAFLKARKIFGGGGNAPALDANVDPTKLNGEGDGRVNILMLGKGGAGHEAPDLTDTILIASIDPIQKEASLLSIPRDLWVKSDTGTSKINAVYANAKYKVLNGKKTSDINDRAEKAGLAAVETKIEDVTGIPVHYYVMVDFTAFEKAINTVGGIDINVTQDLAVYEKLWDPTTRRQYILDVKPGNNKFDGKRALFYARSRQTSARGDFDRAERQRAVIIALKDKIMSAGTYGNPVKINSLVNEFGDHVRSNLSTNEVLRVYDILKGVDSSKIGSVGLADPPNVLVETDRVNGQSVVRPVAGLFDYSKIQNFVRNTLKDGYIKNENASIAVFNGSTVTGLAATRADDLKSFGYNITVVDNAPTKNYSKTILVDLTGGKKKYTQHYLEQRLKVTAVTQLPDNTINPNGAEFVIILGQNESTSQ